MSSSSLAAPSRRRRAHGPQLAAGLAAVLVLTACTPEDERADGPGPPTTTPGTAASGTAPTEPAPSGPEGSRFARYVALGDSFAALGPTAAPTTGPEACHRSTLNYPALLAEGHDVAEFVDVTCGGAETPDMTTPQTAQTPPQLDALTVDTALVTLSIGGNDIGFGAISQCVATTPRAQTGAPCRDRLEDQVTDAVDALGSRLDEVYSGIRGRSPDARIVTTAYLPLVPDHGGCPFVSRMSPGDVTWIRHITERINLEVTAAAERADADAVLPDDAQEHSACADPDVRYTDFTGIETGSHPMHPTAAGHRAMADAVAAVL